jgi:hypothetical protein
MTDEMPDEVPFAGDFLAAIIAERHDILDEMEAREDVDWWNVSLTLAFLIRGAFTEDQQSKSLIEQAFLDAADLRESSGE